MSKECLEIHTGPQEGNGNIIYDSNPVLLSNLFLEYQNARFDKIFEAEIDPELPFYHVIDGTLSWKRGLSSDFNCFGYIDFRMPQMPPLLNGSGVAYAKWVN